SRSGARLWNVDTALGTRLSAEDSVRMICNGDLPQRPSTAARWRKLTGITDAPHLPTDCQISDPRYGPTQHHSGLAVTWQNTRLASCNDWRTAGIQSGIT